MLPYEPSSVFSGKNLAIRAPFSVAVNEQATQPQRSKLTFVLYCAPEWVFKTRAEGIIRFNHGFQ
jgi:hypothetical protein